MQADLPNLISTYSILIPIFIGVLSYKKANNLFRLFLFFLVIGFLTDFIISIFKERNDIPNGFLLFNIYSFIEFFFFSFILYKNFKTLSLKRFALIVLICSLPFWIVTHFYRMSFPDGLFVSSAPFETGSAAIISVLSAIMLLQIVETENDMFRFPNFWLFTGSFLYFFCSALIFTFFEVEFSFLNKIWRLTLIFNVVQYAFYAVAFIKIWKKN